jgi:hypothetical protein
MGIGLGHGGEFMKIEEMFFVGFCWSRGVRSVRSLPGFCIGAGSQFCMNYKHWRRGVGHWALGSYRVFVSDQVNSVFVITTTCNNCGQRHKKMKLWIKLPLIA